MWHASVLTHHCKEVDVEEMVRIPGGSFLQGSPQWVLEWLQNENQAFPQQWFADETPQMPARLAPYWIDRFPVTVARFRQFVRDTGSQTDAESRGYGMVYAHKYWEEVTGVCWH